MKEYKVEKEMEIEEYKIPGKVLSKVKEDFLKQTSLMPNPPYN